MKKIFLQDMNKRPGWSPMATKQAIEKEIEELKRNSKNIRVRINKVSKDKKKLEQRCKDVEEMILSLKKQIKNAKKENEAFRKENLSFREQRALLKYNIAG